MAIRKTAAGTYEVDIRGRNATARRFKVSIVTVSRKPSTNTKRRPTGKKMLSRKSQSGSL